MTIRKVTRDHCLSHSNTGDKIKDGASYLILLELHLFREFFSLVPTKIPTMLDTMRCVMFDMSIYAIKGT